MLGRGKLKFVGGWEFGGWGWRGKGVSGDFKVT
jgi:hypothetical protein